MYFSDHWEINERKLISRLLTRSDVFVDVGASNGFYTCLAATAGVQTVAFEPGPESVIVLQENVRINAFDVEIYPVAVTDRAGVSALFGDGDTASLIETWCNVTQSFRESVPTTTLDRVLSGRWKNQRITIKIDVEGVENLVLRGAGSLLRRKFKPFWIIESFPAYPTGLPCAAFEEVFECMFSSGYAAKVVDEGLTSVTPAMVREWIKDRSAPGRSLSNFLFHDPAAILE